MKTISKIWFEGDWIYGLGDDGKTYRQSLLWYNKLRKATDEQRAKYEMSTIGIHWRELDEDISVRYAFEKDDMKFSNLLSFAASLNAEVLFDVTPLNPSIRNQVGGLLLVSFQSKEYINLIDK